MGQSSDSINKKNSLRFFLILCIGKRSSVEKCNRRVVLHKKKD